MFEEDFKPICVGDLIDKNHKYKFLVPSFQRGYRWEEKQVVDLLEDLDRFIKDQSQGGVYYLQPLIVCKKPESDNEWYLLDGQQRLTTMRLVLLNLREHGTRYVSDNITNNIFDIVYESRAAVDFENPNKDTDINNWYIYHTNETIKEWVKKYLQNDPNAQSYLSSILDALLFSDKNQETVTHKRVKFIWFDISDNRSAVDLNEKIEVYNRFNSNKIKLTPSELIKALYVLNAKNNNIDISNLLNDWNNIEKQFQNDKFWHLFTPTDIQTRIDYLFNAASDIDIGEEKDKDLVYREYQKKYDEKVKNGLEEEWNKVKKYYNHFVQCYEDPVLNNYFGMIIYLGETPRDIIGIIENSSKDYNEKLDELRKKIKIKIWGKAPIEWSDIEQLTYEDNKVKKVLLLHNIETCNSLNHKFDFDSFYLEKWEIEHIEPQNKNSFTSNDQIKEWLGYVKSALEMVPITTEVNALKARCDSFSSSLENGTFRNDSNFDRFITDISDCFSEKDASGTPVPFNSDDKQRIWNLALLDKVTNIAFSNSPFPKKRHMLIENRLEAGKFVPICTERLFLKYYAFANMAGSLDLNFLNWTRKDRENYLRDMHEKLQRYLG